MQETWFHNFKLAKFDILKMSDVTFLYPEVLSVLQFPTLAKSHFSKCISGDFFFVFFNRWKASS